GNMESLVIDQAADAYPDRTGVSSLQCGCVGDRSRRRIGKRGQVQPEREGFELVLKFAQQLRAENIDGTCGQNAARPPVNISFQWSYESLKDALTNDITVVRNDQGPKARKKQ